VAQAAEDPPPLLPAYSATRPPPRPPPPPPPTGRPGRHQAQGEHADRPARGRRRASPQSRDREDRGRRAQLVSLATGAQTSTCGLGTKAEGTLHHQPRQAMWRFGAASKPCPPAFGQQPGLRLTLEQPYPSAELCRFRRGSGSALFGPGRRAEQPLRLGGLCKRGRSWATQPSLGKKREDETKTEGLRVLDKEKGPVARCNRTLS